jgi:hypothetical protein
MLLKTFFSQKSLDDFIKDSNDKHGMKDNLREKNSSLGGKELIIVNYPSYLS